MSVAFIHQTDIFHPHGDPDDHFDLACVYSLAYAKELDLKAVLLDYPPDHRAGDPALIAVAQMNYITGLTVPSFIGTSRPMKDRQDIHEGITENEITGINRITEILRTSPEPVVISIVGSCHDIAIAGKREPDLFKEKCAAIYLNAGTGSPDTKDTEELEYNVRLNSAAYAAIFDLPCPVYWLPCYHAVQSADNWKGIGEYGTMFRFNHNEVLESASDRVKNYFLYMLGRLSDPKWLRYLEREPDNSLIKEFGDKYRRVWSTAGFIHAAGKTVTNDGRIVPIEQAGDKAVFEFIPAKITCSDLGNTKWERDETSGNRFIFRIKNMNCYIEAMTNAVASLLKML